MGTKPEGSPFWIQNTQNHRIIGRLWGYQVFCLRHPVIPMVLFCQETFSLHHPDVLHDELAQRGDKIDLSRTQKTCQLLGPLVFGSQKLGQHFQRQSKALTATIHGQKHGKAKMPIDDQPHRPTHESHDDKLESLETIHQCHQRCFDLFCIICIYLKIHWRFAECLNWFLLPRQGERSTRANKLGRFFSSQFPVRITVDIIISIIK